MWQRRFTLLTMPVEDYPSRSRRCPPAAGRVGSDAFASAVSQVAVAAGKDDTLPMLTGVRMEIEADTVTLGGDGPLPPCRTGTEVAAGAA